MTDKQLRRAKKTELIEMLYYLRKELDELKSENEELKGRLDKFVSEALDSVQSGDYEKSTDESGGQE
jgi:hypothetical protein